MTVREEQLLQLARFCQNLVEALRRAGIGPDKSLELLRACLIGECVKCGHRVSGEDLFALAQAADAGDLSAAVRRLRLGDCARPGCESYVYRLSFQRHPDADWFALLSQVEHIKEEQAVTSAARKRAARLRAVRRVGFALVIVVLLLMLRQWYIGGRIPFIREPEKFRVDPAPPGLETP